MISTFLMPGVVGMAKFREHSRKLVFAPSAQAFFRLELRHAEQMAEYLQPMSLRQLDQFGDGLCNEGHSLVRPAFPSTFVGWRFRLFARSRPLPAARSLAQ
jgi:hypothetical protein